MTPNLTPFHDALSAFVATTQAKLDAHYADAYKNLTPPTLTIDPAGAKNIRIVRNDGGSRAVFCFVRIADGAILKSAGWKAPAKHARGSIYVNAGQDAVGVYGARYLK